MKRKEIQEGIVVRDRWYPELGDGKILKVKKTVFSVAFPREEIKYDFSHAQFLEKKVVGDEC